MHAETLVDWFDEMVETAPADVVDRVDLLMLDFLGNALSGSTSELGFAVRSHVNATSRSGSSQALGDPGRFVPGAAALANAAMASAFDFDEGYHIAGYTIASCLAVAQTAEVSGDRLRRAVAAGYEAGEALRRAADADRDSGGGITSSGWYHVGVIGPLVAAVCAGALLELDSAERCNAVGIATDSTGGVRANFGRGAKQLQPGLAARAGIEAAQLAALGLTGSHDALSGELGIGRAFGAGSPWDWSYITRWSWDAASLRDEIAIRRYPAVGPAQPAIDAVISLRSAHHFSPEDIDRIEVRARPFSLRTPEAADESQLGFSLPYLVATAAVDGHLGITQMRFANARRPLVRELMTRVADADGGRTLRIVLRDGTVLEREEGGINYLSSADQVYAKFRASVPAFSSGRAIEAWVAGLASAPVVGEIPTA
jgi:2-methylcitrate dehydratase PrpD